MATEQREAPLTHVASPTDEEQNVVLFDGVCNFCNDTVNFVLARDRSHHFRFASLQSAAGMSLLKKHGLPPLSTIVVVEAGTAFVRSAAAIRVAWRLGPLYWLLGWIAWFIPVQVRDIFYDAFAKRRYRWFGRADQCRVPSPGERGLFLQ